MHVDLEREAVRSDVHTHGGIAAMSKRDDLTPANRNRRAIRRLTH